MTGRKTAADNEGWRKGQGAYSKAAPLKSQDPWTVKADHDEQPSYTGRYTDNNSRLRQKLPEERRAGNEQCGAVSGKDGCRDLYDDVEGQSSDDTNRAVKSRG